ncbi:RNA polymerase sigma factor [Kangiella koreensis]|uniref:RNA polymerase, sigma-24 subunit, ECF subfamily n=1 Tax=Kangiella koreensis (strain DSM 16069 / JCM 12317 / KCTC 12182 / SW-125) TaxID=523791 RepID=C7R620_KANKD|nr:RNA polymerase sigma factor [Kangiella koreensis]ACV25451.1 RNA polymerase, sigma-24 subunit, ECF subfamily [Kangiella koreensis DSM 16069]
MKQQLETVIPMLRRFAYSLTGNHHDADDLLQSTVERILTKELPDNVDLTKWSFRVCRNLWIDNHRSQKVRQDATQKPELQQHDIVDGEKIMTNQLTVEQVQKALAQLPEEQKSILTLIAVEDLSYKEVAAMLDIPVGTVMSRLSRARNTMVQWFDDHDMRIIA